MLRVESVYKSFDGFMAVNAANLVVEKGEIVAVIGPNGAGKTTLFRLITGQHKPDRGKILFKGEDITGLPPHQICREGNRPLLSGGEHLPPDDGFSERAGGRAFRAEANVPALFSGPQSGRQGDREDPDQCRASGQGGKGERLPVPRRSEGPRNRHCPGELPRTPDPGRTHGRHGRRKRPPPPSS